MRITSGTGPGFSESFNTWKKAVPGEVGEADVMLNRSSEDGLGSRLRPQGLEP